ncbi:hypothetical protein SLE2022_200210 [Rubroshorea leprosula]
MHPSQHMETFPPNPNPSPSAAVHVELQSRQYTYTHHPKPNCCMSRNLGAGYPAAGHPVPIPPLRLPL